MTTLALFAGGLAVIGLAAELFTNAVEWAGFRLRLGTGATGSLLAALGTALPETIVPIVALLAGQRDADRVAIGAVLGGPFLLLTLGMGITGIAAALRRDPVLHAGARQMRRDLATFHLGFAVLAICLVLPRGGRIAGGLVLLALYATHVVRTLRGDTDSAHQAPEPLHLWRPFGRGQPAGAVIAAQLVLSTGALILGADLFVDAITRTAQTIGVPTLVLALLLIPAATELPETLNSLLWVRAGDDALAVGNVTGSAAFQACIPGFVGVCFTSWSIGAAGLLVGGVTLVASASSVVLLWDGECRGRRLATVAVLWLAYGATALALGSRLQA